MDMDAVVEGVEVVGRVTTAVKHFTMYRVCRCKYVIV